LALTALNDARRVNKIIIIIISLNKNNLKYSNIISNHGGDLMDVFIISTSSKSTSSINTSSINTSSLSNSSSGSFLTGSSLIGSSLTGSFLTASSNIVIETCSTFFNKVVVILKCSLWSRLQLQKKPKTTKTNLKLNKVIKN